MAKFLIIHIPAIKEAKMKKTIQIILAMSLAITLGWLTTYTTEEINVDSDVGAGPGANYEQFGKEK